MNNNNNRRRTFRPRPQKSNFRHRNGPRNSNSGSNFNINGNMNFNRNGSMTNPHNVEKTIQKFQQLAKDAQSSGDPVLVENYLQHADHYARRLAELNEKSKVSSSDEKNTILSDVSPKENLSSEKSTSVTDGSAKDTLKTQTK